MADTVLVKVVKGGFKRELNSWVRVSREAYEQHGPTGTGHLAAPRNKHPKVPDEKSVPAAIAARTEPAGAKKTKK